MDVEDLCGQSVVPVLQLGEAGTLDLMLELLSDWWVRGSKLIGR